MTTRARGGVVPEAAAWSVLIVLALVAARNARDGTLGKWLRVKFLNQGAALPLGGIGKVSGKGAATAEALGLAGSAVVTTSAGSGGRLADPAPGTRTGDGFGVPRAGGARTHKGIDLIGPCGTAVRAAESGPIKTFRLTLCGIGANIDHGAGLSTDYCHMTRYAVKSGTVVRRDQTIGYMGNTGNSGGCHLHFEVNVNGREVDPAPYIGR